MSQVKTLVVKNNVSQKYLELNSKIEQIYIYGYLGQEKFVMKLLSFLD